MVEGRLSELFCAVLCTTVVHICIHTGAVLKVDCWFTFSLDLDLLFMCLLPFRFCVVLFLLGEEAIAFAEYWKHFVVCFNDDHAFGYNSAGSERIWMKFGVLRVYCLELALTDFGHDPRRTRRSESSSVSRNFFLSGKQHSISPTCGRPNCTKFAHKTWIYVRMNLFGKHF